MKKWKAILGVCLVFVLGMGAGSLVTIGVGRRIIQRVIKGGPQAINQMLVQRISHELHLSEAQREKAQSIIAEAHQQIRITRRQIDPQIAEVLIKAEVDLRALLGADQQKKFDLMVAKEHERLMRFN